MAKMGKFDMKGFQDLKAQLEKTQAGLDEVLESSTKEIAARLLRLVIKRTPVGDYSGDSYTCESGVSHKGHKVQGKVGGTLRRGWTIGEIKKNGGVYSIDIINPVEYASYVEYGHRTRGGGWQPGHFMMTISEQELQTIAPKVLENKIRKFLRESVKQ